MVKENLRTSKCSYRIHITHMVCISLKCTKTKTKGRAINTIIVIEQSGVIDQSENGKHFNCDILCAITNMHYILNYS